MNTQSNQNAVASVWDPAAQQLAFRKLMTAFSFPGQIETMTPAVDNKDFSVLRMILATLTDGEVTVADPDAMIDDEDWSKLETNRGTLEKARFIIARGDLAPIFSPDLGSLECPEMGATIILRVEHLGEGEVLAVQGPGIEDAGEVACLGLNPAWLGQRQKWNSAFPLGVDMILFDASRVVALPRTTRITTKEGKSWDM